MSSLRVPSLRCPSQAGMVGTLNTPVERPAKTAQNDLYHNDASIDLDFQHGELDDLEGYDYGLNDYYFSEEPDLADGPPDELWRPFGTTEPKLTEDELFKVDSAADDFEILRLLKMNVLEAMTSSAAEQAQHEGSRLLSTKFCSQLAADQDAQARQWA